MPTNQPSSAPQADAPHPADDLTAAAVLHDERLDESAGGGGLGGASAAAGTSQAGAATRNSPIDAPTPHDGGEAQAEREARVRSVSADAPEPHPSSQ